MPKMKSTKSFVYRGTRQEKDAVFDVLLADVRMCRGFGAVDYVEPAPVRTAPAAPVAQPAQPVAVAAAAADPSPAVDDRPRKKKSAGGYETRDLASDNTRDLSSLDNTRDAKAE